MNRLVYWIYIFGGDIGLPYISGLVVEIAVVEHGSEVVNALLGAMVTILFQSLLDSAHVHWELDDFKVILKFEGEIWVLL